MQALFKIYVTGRLLGGATLCGGARGAILQAFYTVLLESLHGMSIMKA
jgi:hypothetical protein